MNETRLTYLFRVEPPWLYAGPGEPDRRSRIPSVFYARPGLNVCVRVLRGQKMRTVAALMDEFAAALQFFDGFGENWWALSDCLSCLDEWLPAAAYVLVIERAAHVLADQPDQLIWLLKTLDEAGASWSRPVADGDAFARSPIAFHALLHFGEGEEAALEHVRDMARSHGIGLRM